ncbi:MAG: hypothetical protein ACXVED_19085, partial [Bacteroidia bacterium]
FVNPNDTSERSIWKMQTSISNTDTLLKTLIFNNKGRVSEIMTEKVLNGNSNIVSYTFYDYDSLGNQITSPCKILNAAVYNSSQNIDEQIKWKVHFKDFQSSDTCELIKVRRLESADDVKKVFSDFMSFKDLKTNEGYQYQLTSIYRKGKGLVSYTIKLPGGSVKNFILINQTGE